MNTKINILIVLLILLSCSKHKNNNKDDSISEVYECDSVDFELFKINDVKIITNYQSVIEKFGIPNDTTILNCENLDEIERYVFENRRKLTYPRAYLIYHIGNNEFAFNYDSNQTYLSHLTFKDSNANIRITNPYVILDSNTSFESVSNVFPKSSKWIDYHINPMLSDYEDSEIKFHKCLIIAEKTNENDIIMYLDFYKNNLYRIMVSMNYLDIMD